MMENIRIWQAIRREAGKSVHGWQDATHARTWIGLPSWVLGNTSCPPFNSKLALPKFLQSLRLDQKREPDNEAHVSSLNARSFSPQLMLRRWPVRRFTSVSCSRQRWRTFEGRLPFQRASARPFHSSTATCAEVTPLRKQLKDAKRQSRSGFKGAQDVHDAEQDDRLKNWELTVGIEIHAQLNTTSKLFSRMQSCSFRLRFVLTACRCKCRVY